MRGGDAADEPPFAAERREAKKAQSRVRIIEAAREIFEALPSDVGRLEIIEGAGHFPWLDVPDAYWPVIEDFVSEVHSLAP